MTDEQELIAQAQQDPSAFRVLYRAYFPRIYAYTAYRVRRQQDAEDVTAEIFIRAAHHLNHFEYRGEGSFTAWLFRIAYNQVQQFYRQSPSSPDLIPLDELPEIHGHDPTPDQRLMRKELFAQLSQMIEKLPDRRREVITLRFFGGLRNQEIAVVLGLDERTIASHLSRALDDLRQEFERDERDEREPYAR
ncbi:MAG: RNA polymerase sigma factor [Anaerolineae bacterium]|nr:RNA polymerase sigma factor [Anaerolineae bacterium]